MNDTEYIEAFVELEGIGKVHCWVAVYVAPDGVVYMGNIQMGPIGPSHGPRDPETGKRPQLRRQFVQQDEQTLRNALMAQLRGHTVFQTKYY